jgi:hypothetical protein
MSNFLASSMPSGAASSGAGGGVGNAFAAHHNSRLRQQKTDHFGLLLQREGLSPGGAGMMGVSTSAGLSAVVAELYEGRLPRLSTVHRFQAGVLLAGCCLAYFYYTMRGYFVLTR